VCWGDLGLWGRSGKKKKKGGGGVAEKVREGETTEGRCAGARARVNDATLSTPASSAVSV